LRQAIFDYLQEKLNELSATLTELDTMGDFVKLSVDNLDELQFKAMLFALNVSTFLARWLHAFLFPSEIGVDAQGQYARCSDGTYMHCPVCECPSMACPNFTCQDVATACASTGEG
jgi:hypothetical protein